MAWAEEIVAMLKFQCHESACKAIKRIGKYVLEIAVKIPIRSRADEICDSDFACLKAIFV
jgi:hypothetical protein